MQDLTPGRMFISDISKNNPSACSWINGNADYPDLSGIIYFFKTTFNGILINAEVFGLPDSGKSDFYGMHIHETGDCTPPFDNTGGHYNPNSLPHPQHAGDMPSLISSNGYAWMIFFDNRFTIEEIIGKSIIIHQMRDDFTTQPSGDSGKKIACGIIYRFS